MLILLLMLILSVYIYLISEKTKKLSVSALSVEGSYDVIVYGWYSDSSILPQYPGVYLGPSV